jgi:carboxyl-terminal processing protease
VNTGVKMAAFGFGAVALFLAGFVWSDVSTGQPPQVQQLKQLVSPTARTLPTPTETFRENFTLIRNASAFEVEPEELRYGAMSGLMASLGDPHNVFLEPKVNEQFVLETQGDFVGIGARLSPNPLGARLVTVFPNGPAKRAGLQPGDVITEVDGQSTAGQEVDDIVTKIRGEAGTNVRLTINREGEDSPLNFTIRRAQVIIPIVEHKVLADGKLGYISISQFSETAPEQFDQALLDMAGRDVQGLVIDLRSNPGGLLNAAQMMLGRFFDGKVVVRMRKRGDSEETAWTPRGRTMDLAMPIVILINEESASASEIFAGVMHDYERATLLGEHTYGKASVQNLIPLSDGSAAKVTIAAYYLPESDDISRRVDEDGMYISGGIMPDIEVKLDVDADTTIGDEETDSQLKAAVEYLLRRP